MKIALIGYGKMGRMVEKLALEQSHTIAAKLGHPLKNWDLNEADVCIDFSKGDSVLDHIEACIQAHKPLIIGTTGWNQDLQKAEKMIAQSSIGCLYSPNFSIGIFLFMEIVSHASKLLASFPQYDVGGVEYHHNQKLDSPSGTAKALSKEVRTQLGRCPDFEFASVRCGQTPGTHTLLFDSHSDTITLTHEARNREDFAQGALKAAEWIIGKKGFFTFHDFIKDSINPQRIPL